MTQLHPIIAAHEDFVRIAERREEIAAAKAANAKLVADAQERFDAKLAEFNAAAARGEDPGERPVLTGILDVEVRRAFTDRTLSESLALNREERDALVENAAEFAADFAAAEADGLARAAKHVEALDAIAAELAPVVEAVKQLRTATGDSTKTADGPVDAVALVSAAHSGRRLLEPSIRTTTITEGNVSLTTRPSPVVPAEERFEVHHRGRTYRSAQRAQRSHEIS